MSKPKLILVTGATGQQGGSVARALVKSNLAIRVLSRNPKSEAARSLERLGAEVVQGDFTSRKSLDAALSGVDAAFLMGTPFEKGIASETDQGIAFIDAAKDAGIGQLVYTSVSDADRGTGIPHFESKYRVEQHLKQSGLRYTIVAPAYFFENHFAPFMLPALQQGSYAVAMPPDVSLQMIAVENIGGFAALVFDRPEEFAGKRINIAGDEKTGAEYAAALSDVAKRRIEYVEVPIGKVEEMSHDMALMYGWFTRVGYSADIEGLRRRYPEVGWLSFADWAESRDWSVLGTASAGA